MKLKGVMTIFLSLILVITTSFLLTLLYSLRVQGSRLLVESSSEVAISSLFGSYDEILFKEYGLFGKDFSYGSDQFLLSHGQNELEKSLRDNMSLKKLSTISLIQPTTTKVGIIEYECLTDQTGLVFMDQVRELMKTEGFNAPLGSALSYLKDFISEKESFDVMEELYTISKDINFYDDLGDEYGDGTDVFLEYMTFNISDKLNLKNSTKSLSKDNKERQVGNMSRGIAPFDLADQVMIGEYSGLYFGNYQSPGRKALNYELEYLIVGGENDQDNLKKTIQRIFMIQWAYQYLKQLSDPSAYQKANSLALVLAGYAGEPAITMTTQLILLHNGYKLAETDIKKLMANEKVSLEIGGMDLTVGYTDYLQALLLLEKPEIKVGRMMKIIECNLRLSDGYQNFRLDTLVTNISIRSKGEIKHPILPIQFEYDTSYGYQ